MLRRADAELNDLLVNTYQNVAKVESCMLTSQQNDLSIAELHILECVGRGQGGSCSISRIAQAMEITLPTVTVAVKRLEKKGYVVKNKDENDGRVTRVALTARGRKMGRRAPLFPREHGAVHHAGDERGRGGGAGAHPLQAQPVSGAKAERNERKTIGRSETMKIIGTGSALPEQIVTNEDLTKFLDTSDEWIVSHTGIRERRVLDRESVNDIGTLAARRALEDAGLALEELDLLICSNVASDYFTPGPACFIAGALGFSGQTLDMNGACTGFLQALDIADAYLRAGKARNVLIVAAEKPSYLADWTDRATCVLFGDGAGAVVLQNSRAERAASRPASRPSPTRTSSTCRPPRATAPSRTRRARGDTSE